MGKRKVGKTISDAPGRATSFIADLFVGNKRIVITPKSTFWDKLRHAGLVGMLLQGIDFVLGTVSRFIHRHKHNISIIFWTALAVALAVTIAGLVCLYCFPTAFSAAIHFSFFGLSLFSLAGASAVGQIGIAIGLAAAAAVALCFITIALVRAIQALIDLCTGKKEQQPPVIPQPQKTNIDLNKTTKNQAAEKPKWVETPGNSKPFFSEKPRGLTIDLKQMPSQATPRANPTA